MANVGTLNVAVVADTTQAKRDVKAFTQEVQREQDRVERVIRRTEQVGRLGESVGRAGRGVGQAGLGVTHAAYGLAGVAGTGLIAKDIAMGGASGKALRSLARGQFLQAGAQAAGGTFGAATRVITLLANLHPALKAILAIGSILTVGGAIFGRRRGAASAEAERLQQQQLAALIGIQRESINQRKTLEEIQAEQMRAEDPFRRSIVTQRARIAELGVGVTAAQARQAAQRQQADQELAMTLEAIRRQTRGPMFDVGTRIREVTTEVAGTINTFITWYRSAYGTGTPETGGGVTQTGRAIGREVFRMIPQTRFLEGIIERVAGPDLFPRFFDPARRTGEDRGESVQEEYERRLRNTLFFQQQRGPGNVLAAAPTVRAGTESEYAFRVAQQRRVLQQEQNVQYWERVIRLLEALVNRSLATQEELERAKISANQTAGLTVPVP